MLNAVEAYDLHISNLNIQ